MSPLRNLFIRAKRRAWLLVAIRSASHALAITATIALLIAPVRSSLPIRGRMLLEAATILVIAITIILTARNRRRIPAYFRPLDDSFDAAGRIIAASEFLSLPEIRSPFHTLALADTAAWVAKRPAVRLPWTWPTRWAALSLALALLASPGCQKPQQKTVESPPTTPTGKIKVEQPDPGDHLTKQPPSPPPPGSSGSTGGNGMFGQPAERPGDVTYGTQQFQADRGLSSSGGSGSTGGSSTSRIAAQPNNNGSGSSGLSRSAANNSGVGTNSGMFGQKPAPPSPKPGPSAPNAPPGGSMAGRGPGQKQSDPRGVTAARKDVAANAKKGGGKGDEATRLPGERKPGTEFAQGGPAASTQPVGDVNFDEVELDEMAIERLPPEQRERIRQYNANLRKLRQTTQPHGS